MSPLVLRLELRRSRKLLFWIAATAVLYSVFIAAYYPTLAADTEMIDTMLERFPKAMIAAFGMEGNIAAQGTYFNVYLLSMLWPLVAAIVAILVPTRTLGADLDRGFLELPLATPVSRTRYLLSAIGAQVALLAILAGTTILAILVTLLLVGVAFDVLRWLTVALLALALACAIAAVTTLPAVLTLNRGVAGGIVAGVLVLMYLAQTIAKLEPSIDVVSYLSAFHYFSPAPVVNDGSVPLAGLGVFGITAVAAWGAALWAFRRRDVLA